MLVDTGNIGSQMDFSWSSEDREFYDKVCEFSADCLNTDLADRVKQHRFCREAWDACGEFGLLGLSVAEQYGGLGFGPLRTARSVEAMGYGCEDAGLVFSSCAHLFACAMSIEHGASEQLKSEILADLCSGKLIGANAATESEAGSDFSSLKTRFDKDGDDFLINGEKHFVTNGPVADEIVVYASSNPDRGFLGISAFVVPRDAVGLSFGQSTEKTGLTTSPMCSLYLDNCRVPARRRMIKPGGVVFIQSMQWERACLFAAWLGTMERQLQRSIDYANERVQFGSPIGKNQAISHKLVDAKLALESSRLLLYKACWLMEQGENATASICLSKLAVSEALVDSAMFDIQLRGASGITTQGGVEQQLRDALASRIYSGTNEIMREIVAREMGL